MVGRGHLRPLKPPPPPPRAGRIQCPGTPSRRPERDGAMKATGERYFPSLANPQLLAYEPFITYEHWHRYLYATPYCAGKVVLDIASGEGYGSALLAEHAAEVHGVDLSEEAVEHARRAYPRPNLRFTAGSASAIPIPGEHRFDVVVSFETIEHLDQPSQDLFLREVRRLLKPDGVFLVSTPNRAPDDAPVEVNPLPPPRAVAGRGPRLPPPILPPGPPPEPARLSRLLHLGPGRGAGPGRRVPARGRRGLLPRGPGGRQGDQLPDRRLRRSGAGRGRPRLPADRPFRGGLPRRDPGRRRLAADLPLPGLRRRLPGRAGRSTSSSSIGPTSR